MNSVSLDPSEDIYVSCMKSNDTTLAICMIIILMPMLYKFLYEEFAVRISNFRTSVIFTSLQIVWNIINVCVVAFLIYYREPSYISIMTIVNTILYVSFLLHNIYCTIIRPLVWRQTPEELLKKAQSMAEADGQL